MAWRDFSSVQAPPVSSESASLLQARRSCWNSRISLFSVGAAFSRM
ncbi:hypothetical protein [Streptomyces sp. Mo3]